MVLDLIFKLKKTADELCERLYAAKCQTKNQVVSVKNCTCESQSEETLWKTPKRRGMI